MRQNNAFFLYPLPQRDEMSLGKNPEKTEKGLPQSKYPSCKADIASYEGSRAPTLIMSVKSKKEKQI